jgi:Tol biopolymer transport system component
MAGTSSSQSEPRNRRTSSAAGPRTKVFSASFSPDGTAITLGMSGIDDEADVYTIGIDGAGLTPLTRTSAWDSAPDWGPATAAQVESARSR